MKKFWLALCLLLTATALAQPPQADSSTFVISGTVKSGNLPLPGVSIVIGDSSGRKVVTSTDAGGNFSAVVPGAGEWVVRAELVAFSSATRQVLVDAAHPGGRVEFQLALRSREPSFEQRAQRFAAAAGGMQRLSATEDAELAGANGTTDAANGGAESPLPGMPALGTSADAAADSLAISGAVGSTQDFARNFDDLRERIQEMRERGQLPGDNAQVIQRGGGMGPGMGPFGGMGGGGRGGRPGFNVNQPHGSLFYSFGNSALDAAPYSLSGLSAQPDYGSSRFGGVLGGPFRIPKLYDDGGKTFFFVSVFGTRATTPYDVFSHVPTALEREGDFSQSVFTSGPRAGQPIQIFDPQTGLPFAGNVITQPLNPAALALLPYIPLPNQPGAQNYRYSTSAENNGTNISARLIHNFGTPQRGRRGPGGFRSRNNINFGFNYSSSNSDVLRPFPTLGGATNSQGISLNGGYSVSRGHLTNQLRVNFNQQNVETGNRFAGVLNVAAAAGINGVSQNPADWGVSGLSFSDYQGLSDVAPLERRDRVYMVSDNLIWNHAKHTLRLGGDYRRMLTRLRNNSNPWGSFTFTGFATAQYTCPVAPCTVSSAGATPVSGTGYDLADFLLGYAQQTAIQYGPYTYHFAANGWDLYLQDSWRLRGNLTLELGLRYEYVSPYTESDSRLVNLDAAPGFTAVAPVEPGQTGPYTGVFPASLVKPDRHNFAPRVGVAWKPIGKMVVRAGYGINYNLGQYKSIVQQLAFQPPFSFTQTNIVSATTPLTLQNGFPAPAPGVITNSYGIDPNYRLGYVQMWNLNLQYELSPTLMLNVGYTGSKGTALDMVRAPNRGPDGLLLAGVQPFLWESSEGSSILHSGSVRLRKRMSKGLSVGGTYTFAKSIDNASSIGGGTVVVAQNDLDLAAERGLSSFDVRHRLTGDFVYEFPFGTGKRWLDHRGLVARALGDWSWSGSFTIQSGNPWTARVIGDIADVQRGSNGSLRADYNGQSIALPNPSVLEWFNVAAFTVPTHGQFGDAGRNTIIGPGQIDFDMNLAKNFPIKDMMGVEVRLVATNVFNTPHFTAIDTTVNSPTFGQVISVGPMRRLQIMTRFRF